MKTTLRIAGIALVAAAAFCAGALYGARSAAQAAPGPVSQPKSIIHISLIKWKADSTEAQRKEVIDDLVKLAGELKGIQNLWIKPRRMQPRDYHTAFAIEFENAEAADRYATDPKHEAWTKKFLAIREASTSPQITNP